MTPTPRLLLAFGLAAGVASVIAWRFSGPAISPVEVAWTPAGPVLEFTRQPAGPAALVIESPSQTRTLATTSPDGVHHALPLDGLLPGQRITAVPLADGRRGLPVRVVSRASALAGLDEREESDGALTVRFTSALPARCRVQVEAANGPEWLRWEPDATTRHAIAVPASLAPVRGVIAIQVETGEEAPVEPVPVTPAARLARRVRLADALERQIAPYQRDEFLRKRKRLPVQTYPAPPLPAWLAAELGGPGGALDDRTMPPRRKDSLYRALVWLADNDRALPADRRTGWAELPRARDFGPSASARYPDAERVPLDGDRERTRPMPLWSQETRAKDLPSKNVDPFSIVGKPELDHLGPDAHVELHARATLPAGRWLAVSINGFYQVRLGEPGPAATAPRDLWVALDPAYFVTGYNVVSISTDGGPGADLDAPAVIEPPGLEICVSAR